MDSISDLVNGLKLGRISLHDVLAFQREKDLSFRLHPLGFIACTLLSEGSLKARLHIWPSDGEHQQSPYCQIHDHLFEFQSWVLSGSIKNIEYQKDPDGFEFSIYETSYRGDWSVLNKTQERIRLSRSQAHRYDKGSKYSVNAGVLHETERVGGEPAVTLLITTDISNRPPLIAGPLNGEERYEYFREAISALAVEAIISRVRF